MWDHGVLIQTQLSYWPGMLAGVAGGIAMLFSFMLLAKAVKTDIWWLPNRLGAVLTGRTDGGPSHTALGLAAHLAASAAFSAVYAILVSGLTHELWLTAVGYALLLWVFNFWGGQLFAAGRKTMQQKPAWLSPLVHVVYGGIMAWVAEAFTSGTLHI